METEQKIALVAVTYLPFLFSLCFHEYAHAWMAKWRGDKTAEMMGRLTLNPMAHADMFGTFIMPILSIFMGGIFFGYAKPVIFDERNLKKPKSDIAWIAAAGPLANIFLTFISVILFQILLRYFDYVGEKNAQPLLEIIRNSMMINLSLAFFNLIPLPPLDGAKVLQAFLPYEMARKLEALEAYSFFIIMGMILTGAIVIIQIPMQFTLNIIMKIVEFIF